MLAYDVCVSEADQMSSSAGTDSAVNAAAWEKTTEPSHDDAFFSLHLSCYLIIIVLSLRAHSLVLKSGLKRL